MRLPNKIGATVALTVVAAATAPGLATAAEINNVALRAGETADLGPLFFIAKCRSILKGTPTAEVMDGPAQLTVSVKPQKVLPRGQACAAPVDGGELFVTAGDDIKSRLEGKMFIRVNYDTKDGQRQNGREIDYVLFPKTSN